MITTTLNAIRKHKPCIDSWKALLRGLGKTRPDAKPLPFHRIVDIRGLEDALWATRAAPQYDREWRLFAVACARDVQHLMGDPRSVAALDVAERFANGQATQAELDEARGAAWAARDAATEAAWAARHAVLDTVLPAWAASEAASAAASAAASGRTFDVLDAVWAARDAARGVEWPHGRPPRAPRAESAAWGAARDKQQGWFLDLVGRGHE
jgi:hypothetical protein